MVQWKNYFLNSKDSRLIHNHINSENLIETILKHDGQPAYCCYFDLDADSLKVEYDFGKVDKDGKPIYTYIKQGEKPSSKDHKKPHITFTDYEGLAKPMLGLISFDFDDEENPENALEDVRSFCNWLGITNLGIFYSGSKGFHIVVPEKYLPFEHNEHLPNQLKDLAKELKKKFKTLDTSIYNYNRKFRVPFSMHEKTGLYKTWIPVESINDFDLDYIKALAKRRNAFNFLDDLDFDVNALEEFIDAWEASKRASYEIEKDKAGTKEKPSPFEKFDDKKCIQKLLESTCDDVGRNNAAMVIVNDFFRTGKPRAYAEEKMEKWANANGLPTREVKAIITNIYERNANYNFGCQSEIKSSYCTAKCVVWKKLSPEKRPQVVDAPTSSMDAKAKEFENVELVLTKTFKCEFDEAKGKFVGGLIAKQGKDDIFFYQDNAWKPVSENDLDNIKIRFNFLNNGRLKIKDMDSMLKMFITYIPTIPDHIDLFTPNPSMVNFKNGTLHLCSNEDGAFYLDFREHNPLDYLTSRLDFNYVENGKESAEFVEWLASLFEGDEDVDDKVNAIQEMFGASLIPYFPHLFYLYGVAQSGKSTIMLILYEMLKGNNISGVQPKDFYGYGLESMVGKLVNMVTDVDTRRPINDDIVKQIEDRTPITVKRKYKSDLRVPLPSVHVFGGNDLIPSYDGYTDAMKRRWTILKFNRKYDGPMKRNFAHMMFKNNSQGIVNFAINGLVKLVESQGKFTTFASSNNELEEWAEDSNLFKQYLDHALNGETDLDLVKHENAKIERKSLWDEFNVWQEESVVMSRRIGRNDFYKLVCGAGFTIKIVDGVRYFSGLGALTDVVENNNSVNQKNSDI